MRGHFLAVAGAVCCAAAWLVGCGGGGGSAGSGAAGDPLRVATDVVVADIDADQRADLLTLGMVSTSFESREGRLTVQRQTAPGQFTAPEVYSVGRYPWRLRVADLDRDGAPDLLVAEPDDRTVWWLRQDPAARGRMLAPRSIVTGAVAYDVVAGDFDADGRLDVAAVDSAQASARIVVALQSAGAVPSFGAPVTVAVLAGHRSAGLASADVDADGRDDLVAWISEDVPGTTVSTGRLGYLLQQRGGGFGTFVTVATRSALTVGRVAALDYFADGTTTLLAFLKPQDGSRPTELLIAGLDPVTGAAARLPYGVMAGIQGNDDAAFADLDGDGRTDVAVAGFFPAGSEPLAPTTVRARVNVFRQSGDGSLQLADTLAASFSVSRIAAADVDGDGHDDLVLHGGNDRLQLLRQSSTSPGRFESARDVR